MPTIFPGAVWRPMPGQEKRPARRKGRGVGLHVAVYTGPSIYDINVRTGNDAHLYVRLDGSVEQNVDLNLQAWAGVDGNPSMIWVETAGGVDPKTVNTEQWTPPQAATLARIARWAHDTEGTPLQLMPDSKAASRGIGSHRLGIQHSRGVGAVPGWLVAGGEKWSGVLGKECPGDAKVAQLPSIIAAASSGAPAQEDDMQLTDPIESRIDADINKATGVGKMVTVKDVLQNIQWNADEAHKLAAQAVSQNAGLVKAIVDGLLDYQVDRAEVGRGPTSLRAFLVWDDNHVDALASGVAAAASAGAASTPDEVRQLVAAAVNSLDVKLTAG